MSVRDQISAFYQQRTSNREEEVRLNVFFISMVLVLFGMPLHIIGLIGEDAPYLIIITWVYLLMTLCIFVLYLIRRLSLISAFFTYGVLAQALETIRMILLCVLRPEGYPELLFANQVISYTILLYLTLGFIPNAPIYVTMMSMASLFFAGFYDGGVLNAQIVIFFCFVEICTCILAVIIQRGVHGIQEEAAEYKTTQDSLLKVFKMSQKELIAYLQLCRTQKPDSQDIASFFDQLDDQSENNLIHAVDQRRAERELRLKKFTTLFPQLTKTETEVCRLILAGKTQQEIARIMCKSNSNVGTVRGHIRKKLGLSTDVDLRGYLITCFGSETAPASFPSPS